MQISQSVKLAGLIVLLVVLYFLVRSVFSGVGTAAVEAAAPDDFTVLAETVSPTPWQDEIIVRGRTEAARKVVVRAETAGVVAATPAERGAFVEEGAVLCRIAVDARRAQRAEARAALAKAKLDYDAAVGLSAEGFRSDAAVASARAARDQAAAAVEQAEVELEKTDIRAPFAGIFDDRPVEAGDFLKIGDACGTLIQRSPFLVVGAVSEKDVAKIAKGDRGSATLATGETVEGVIRFIAAAADPATRTFTVELEAPNEDGAIRDGVTAEFTIFATKRDAHKLPRSALTLNDAGQIGARIVNGDGAVRFVRLNLLGESVDGVWVSGLQGDATVITRGQDFVTEGQIVNVEFTSDSASAS